MKTLVRVILALTVAVALLSGCDLLLSSIKGDWVAVNDLIVDAGGPALISNMTMTFGDGTYRADYNYTYPADTGTAEACWHSGTFTPGDPKAGDDFTLTVSTGGGSARPSNGATVVAKVDHLAYAIVVISIDSDGDGLYEQTWGLERQ